MKKNIDAPDENILDKDIKTKDAVLESEIITDNDLTANQTNGIEEIVNSEVTQTINSKPQDFEKISEKDSKRRDLILNGNMWKVIFIISLPLMLISVLNFFYSIFDTMIASRMSTDSIASVVVLSQINNMLMAVGMSLASGGVIILSRMVGRRNYDRAKIIANTMVTLSVIVAVGMVVILVPLAKPLLKMLNTSDEIIASGLGYFQIQIATSGVMIFNNVFIGLEKSRGRTTNILFLNMGVMAIKVTLSLLLVYVGHVQALYWISLSTLLANSCLTIFAVIRIMRPNYVYRYSFKNKDFSKSTILGIFKISIPIFIGRFVFSLGKVLVNSMSSAHFSSEKYKNEFGDNYGDTVTGALGVSNNLGGFTTNVLNSIDESEALIISSNLGNKNKKRALQAFWYSMILNMTLAILGVILYSIFNDQLIKALITDSDPQYMQMVSDIFFYEKFAIIALAINSTVNGLLYGFGYTLVAGIMNLSRVIIFRVPVLAIMLKIFDNGYKSVGIAMMISNVSIGVMSIIVATVCLLRIRKKTDLDTLKIK